MVRRSKLGAGRSDSERYVVSKTIYLYWNKEINKEKGGYGIQETEDATQDRDEGIVKRNSGATSVQQTWRTISPDWSQRTEKSGRIAPRRADMQQKQ